MDGCDCGGCDCGDCFCFCCEQVGCPCKCKDSFIFILIVVMLFVCTYWIINSFPMIEALQQERQKYIEQTSLSQGCSTWCGQYVDTGDLCCTFDGRRCVQRQECFDKKLEALDIRISNHRKQWAMSILYVITMGPLLLYLLYDHLFGSKSSNVSRRCTEQNRGSLSNKIIRSF